MNEIRSTLDQTHWFFLLLPDAIIDRSWTMFEAGFFRRAMRPGDRLFCILHPTITPAGPLEGFERTSADTEKILQLFKSLLCTKGAVPGMDIINSALTDAHLKTFANNLVEKIRPSYKLVRRFYVNYVDLKLDQDKPIRDKADLLATQATAGLNLDRMFLAGAELEKPTQDETDAEAGSRDGITFGEILGGDARGPEQDEWLDDLAKTIEAVFDGREPESVEAVFQAADARQYRPVLHTVRRYKHNDALVAAHVAFQEVLTGPLPRAPRELDALATALRLGYRFRWEILEEFRNIANRQEVRRMHRILRRMERESRQRNLDQPRTMTPNEFNDLPLVQCV